MNIREKLNILADSAKYDASCSSSGSSRKNSNGLSDCSEKISYTSIVRKIPDFKTNFEEENDNNEEKKNKNCDNNG